MSTTMYFASNVTRILDRADAALVSPEVRPPLTQLAFRVDQSPVPGAEVGTPPSGRRSPPRRSAGTAQRLDGENNAALLAAVLVLIGLMVLYNGIHAL